MLSTASLRQNFFYRAIQVLCGFLTKKNDAVQGPFIVYRRTKQYGHMKNGTRIQTRVLNYLRDHNVANLATGVGSDIWASAVFYANDGFTLYFLSSPHSRHCLNIAKNPVVAVTIQEDYSDWLEIKGIQIEGVVSEISGTEETRARRLYGEKFPVVGKLALAPAAIVKALAEVSWFKIVPTRLYFIDNSVGLGHREEIDVNVPRS